MVFKLTYGRWVTFVIYKGTEATVLSSKSIRLYLYHLNAVENSLSPVGMFEGKAPLRLAAQKSRPRAPFAPTRSAPAYFLCKWGI
jgi:hypothetical protein